MVRRWSIRASLGSLAAVVALPLLLLLVLLFAAENSSERERIPNTPVLILSMHTHSSYATRVLKAGAAGYVSKDSARAHLVAAIRRLVRGERYLPPAFAETLAFDLMDGGGRRRHEALSEREFQVLCMIAQASRPARSPPT